MRIWSLEEMLPEYGAGPLETGLAPGDKPDTPELRPAPPEEEREPGYEGLRTLLAGPEEEYAYLEPKPLKDPNPESSDVSKSLSSNGLTR